MIEQYLSNTNEIATVLILPKILELNKAYMIDQSIHQRACMHATCICLALNIMDTYGMGIITLHVAMWWTSARSKIHNLFLLYTYKRIRIYDDDDTVHMVGWLAGLPFYSTQ